MEMANNRRLVQIPVCTTAFLLRGLRPLSFRNHQFFLFLLLLPLVGLLDFQNCPIFQCQPLEVKPETNVSRPAGSPGLAQFQA